MSIKVKPIPRNLLIHTITYEEFTGDAAFGEQFSPPVVIANVLIQPLHKTRRDSNGVEVEVNSLVFLDSVNTPLARPLISRSKVSFGADTLRVITCEPLYAFDPVTPHHYEVTLV